MSPILYSNNKNWNNDQPRNRGGRGGFKGEINFWQYFVSNICDCLENSLNVFYETEEMLQS